MYISKTKFKNTVALYGGSCDYALFRIKVNGVDTVTAVKGRKEVSKYLKYLQNNFNDVMKHLKEDIYLVEFALPNKNNMSVEFLQAFFDLDIKDAHSFKEI